MWIVIFYSVNIYLIFKIEKEDLLDICYNVLIIDVGCKNIFLKCVKCNWVYIF